MNFCKKSTAFYKGSPEGCSAVGIAIQNNGGKIFGKRRIFLAILKCCVYNGRDSERKKFV